MPTANQRQTESLASTTGKNLDLARNRGKHLDQLGEKAENLDNHASNFNANAKSIRDKAKYDHENSWDAKVVRGLGNAWKRVTGVFSRKKKEKEEIAYSPLPTSASPTTHSATEVEEKYNSDTNATPSLYPKIDATTPLNAPTSLQDRIKALASDSHLIFQTKVTVWSWSRLSWKNKVFNPRMQLTLEKVLLDMANSGNEKQVFKAESIVKAYRSTTTPHEKSEQFANSLDNLKTALNYHRHGSSRFHLFKPISATIYDEVVNGPSKSCFSLRK